MLTIFRYACAQIKIFRFPEGTPPQLRHAGRAFACLIAPLCVTSEAWGDQRALFRAAAVTVAISAVICWASAIVASTAGRHDDDFRAVIRQNAELWSRIPPADRPAALAEVAASR